ncbi:MAG: ATPase domain-containing protein [Thermoplasmata archaeon]
MAEGRVPTGVEGLDALLNGGFPVETVNLVSGPPGSGRSLFCIHFIYEGVEKYGEPGLYITLEESHESLIRAMKSLGLKPELYETDGDLIIADLGWFTKELGKVREAPASLAGMDLLREKGRANRMDMEWLSSESDAQEELDRGFVGFRTLREVVGHMVEKRGIRRLAVDSVAAIGLMYESAEVFRKELFTFGRFLREKKLTSLLVTETVGASNAVMFGVEHFLTDSHISLNFRNIKGEFLRTVSVQKMRFGRHDTGIHPFIITSRGIEINTREYVVL